MTENILLLVLGGLILGVLVYVTILLSKLSSSRNNQSADLIKQDLIELTRGVGALKDNLQTTVTDRLDKNSALMQSSMAKQLSESAKLIGEVTQRLTKLDETNRRVVDVADELKTLQNVLQNPKQRGVLGEYFLQSVLENVMPPDRFSLQYRFDSGDIADAVIFLDKDKFLAVDSKFSLENYNRLVEAKDKNEREQLVVRSKLISKTVSMKPPNTSGLRKILWTLPSCLSPQRRCIMTC